MAMATMMSTTAAPATARPMIAFSPSPIPKGKYIKKKTQSWFNECHQKTVSGFGAFVFIRVDNFKERLQGRLAVGRRGLYGLAMLCRESGYVRKPAGDALELKQLDTGNIQPRPKTNRR